MSNTDTTVTDTETTPEAVDATEDTTAAEDHTEPPEDDDGSREAAKWRRKLRDTEGERDALAARLEAVQRQQIENLLAASGVKPQAVWAVAELADLLADDGSIDTDSVTKAVTAARERFGIATPGKGSVVPGVGNQPTITPQTDAWKEAFTPARKR